MTLSKASAPPPSTPEGAAIIEYARALEGRLAEAEDAIAGIALPPSSSVTTAADHGFCAWSFDPVDATATAAPSTGLLFQERTKAALTTPAVGLLVPNGGRGSGITLAKAAVFDAAGAQLAVSANDSANWGGAGGDATITFASPTRALVVGEKLFLSAIWVGTTGPSLRSKTAATSASMMKLGLSTSDGYRCATLSGQTDMPSSLTFASMTEATTRRLFVLVH